MPFAPLPSRDTPLSPVGHTSAETMATVGSPAGGAAAGSSGVGVRKEGGFDEWPLL